MTFRVQDPAGPAHTVVLPPELVAPAATAAPAPEPRRIAETAEPTRKLGERDVPEPAVGGLLLATVVVAVLAGVAWLLFRRVLRGSKLFKAQGLIQVLGRRAVAARQELLVVEVAGRVFLVGSTRERLSTLGELGSRHDLEPAAPAPEAPAAPAREPEAEPVGAGAYDGLSKELAQIRRSIQAWKE